MISYSAAGGAVILPRQIRVDATVGVVRVGEWSDLIGGVAADALDAAVRYGERPVAIPGPPHRDTGPGSQQ